MSFILYELKGYDVLGMDWSSPNHGFLTCVYIYQEQQADYYMKILDNFDD